MQGLLMPVGGAEDKVSACHILNRFVQFCGEDCASIVIIPSASSMPVAVANRYRDLFYRFGVQQVTILDVVERQQANSDDFLQKLENASGVFITGGDQLRLMSLIGGTRLMNVLGRRYRDGMHVGGTSAGASIMSQHMIAFGRSGAVPSQRMVQMASGLGLAPNYIIDQHFSQRNRLGRLVTAVALNPGLTGIGIDEDTAVILSPDGTFHVLGSGTVTIVDSRELTYNGVYAAKRYDQFTVEGLNIQILRETEQAVSIH